MNLDTHRNYPIRISTRLGHWFFLLSVVLSSSFHDYPSSFVSSVPSLLDQELNECRNRLALARSYRTHPGTPHLSASPPSSYSSSSPHWYTVRTSALEVCGPFTPDQVLGNTLIDGNSTMDAALEIGHISLLTYEDCKLRYFPSLSAASTVTSSSSSSSPCFLYQRMALQYYQVAYNTPKGQNDPYLVHNFGVLLRSFGYHKEASLMFQRAIVTLQAKDPGPYIELGLDYRQQGQCKEALEIFLQGLDVPNILPGTHNEYALVSNIFSMLMNCGDVPDSLLYRTLHHPIITHSALYYPHVAMFIAHVRGITGQWGLDADQNAEQLLNAFISAQSIYLTSPLSYRLLSTTFFSLDYQKFIVSSVPDNNRNILPSLSSLSSIDTRNWSMEKFLQYQNQVLLPPLYDNNSTYRIKANVLQWLQQKNSIDQVNLYDISHALTDMPHASILADSCGNTAAFEISYIELPQWIMPFASALSSLIKQSLKEKEDGTFPLLTVESFQNPVPSQTVLRRWYTLPKNGTNGTKNQGISSLSFPLSQKASRLPKLRLAYLSPDFRRHAIGYMMFGTFASHNRSKVHVTAYHTKEIGNKFGLKGMFRIPQRIAYVNISHGSSSGTVTISSGTESRSTQCKQVRENAFATVIASPDWSDSIIEHDIVHNKLDPYVDWSQWARRYVTPAWKYKDTNNTIEPNHRTFSTTTTNPFIDHIGTEYCNKDAWTHTGRLAMVTDSFYSSLLWPQHTTDDIVNHIDTVTQPHILIDLAGPTFGNTGPVCRARPGVLTVHYLSGPISTGSRNDADFAIVDKIVLPPDVAFHAPQSPADRTLIYGYRSTNQPLTNATNVYEIRSSTIIAQSMVQGIPSLFHYRNESRVRYRQTRSTVRSPKYNRTPLIRDFTESLVYINLPFQANTLPSSSELPYPSVSIQNQTFNCPIDHELPSPCNQLYYPVLGGSRVPTVVSSSSSSLSIPTKGYSSYLCPNRNRIVFAALYGSVKITSHAYTAWMNILRQVPSSELWLLLSAGRTGEGVYAQTMWAEAMARGIHPNRIVFITESPRETFWYLFPCIDVFLDTWIYGAHSTGADVLRFGIPVITRDMNTFASRVVSSLIRSIGTGKDHKDTSLRSLAQRLLISNSAISYEESAVRITRTVDRYPSKFIDPTVAPLARQLKLRLLPLVGAYTVNTTKDDKPSNVSAVSSPPPPPPYNYVDQAYKLEQGYRTIWEIRSIMSQGFARRSEAKSNTDTSVWTYEEVNGYKYPHIIVNPDTQG